MKALNFLSLKKILARLKRKIIFTLICFVIKNNLVYPVYILNEKFESCTDLLLITDGNKSHYVYIKDFNRFMWNKTKKNKKYFCKYCLQCFISERVLIGCKETCLKISGKQNVKLKSCSIKLKNHFKKLVVLFRIYAAFESILERVKSDDRNNKTSYTGKYQKQIPCCFAHKVVCVDVKLSNPIVLYRGKMQFIDSIK